MAINASFPEFEDIWIPIQLNEDYKTLEKEWQDARIWVREHIAIWKKNDLVISS